MGFKRHIFKLVVVVSHCSLVVSQVQADFSACDETFEKLYLAKRACVLNADQEGCRQLGTLSALYPVIGGAATLAAAKIYNTIV